MGKFINFTLNEMEFSFTPNKVDRSKLYGWTEIVAIDDDGNECKTVSMDESGTVIIPKGCLGLGMVNENYEWVDKSELKAIDENGIDIEPFPSSFDETIQLAKTVTYEEFLNHNITFVYQLDEEGSCQELIDYIKNKQDILCFEFNYRAGYEKRPAFLMESEGKLFALIGEYVEFEFIGYEEKGYIDETEDNEEFSEEIGLDFNMM